MSIDIYACFYCHEFGHVKANCPKRTPRAKAPVGAPLKGAPEKGITKPFPSQDQCVWCRDGDHKLCSEITPGANVGCLCWCVAICGPCWERGERDECTRAGDCKWAPPADQKPVICRSCGVQQWPDMPVVHTPGCGESPSEPEKIRDILTAAGLDRSDMVTTPFRQKFKLMPRTEAQLRAIARRQVADARADRKGITA